MAQLVLSRRFLPLVLVAAAGFCLLLQVADESPVSVIHEDESMTAGVLPIAMHNNGVDLASHEENLEHYGVLLQKEATSDAVKATSEDELKSLSEANVAEKSKVAAAGKSQVTTSDVKQAEDTAKAATEASDALAGAAGYADIAHKHLSGVTIEQPTAASSESKAEADQDEEALKELKAKPVQQEVKEEEKATSPKPDDDAANAEETEGATPTKTLEKISKAVDGEGSEQEKIEKVKHALAGGGDEEASSVETPAPAVDPVEEASPAVLPATESKAAKAVTEKMLDSLERRNERWEKREEAPPDTGYKTESKGDLDDIHATAVAARAAHTAEAGAAGYAHLATKHLEGEKPAEKTVLVEKISRTGDSVMKDLISEEEEAVKKEEKKLKAVGGDEEDSKATAHKVSPASKKGFTKEEISDSKETAVAARKASDALHGSMGYSAIAANVLAGKNANAAAESGSEEKTSPETAEDLKVDPLPPVEEFHPGKAPSPPSAPDEKPKARVKKTGQIKKVIEGEGSEEQKIDQIKDIVKDEEAGGGGDDGETDPLAHPDEKEQDEDREGEVPGGASSGEDHADIVKAHQEHLDRIKKKLAYSKNTIDNLEDKEASAAAKAAVEAKAAKVVKKETDHVADVVEKKTGAKPAAAEKVAIQAVKKAADEHPGEI